MKHHGTDMPGWGGVEAHKTATDNTTQAQFCKCARNKLMHRNKNGGQGTADTTTSHKHVRTVYQKTGSGTAVASKNNETTQPQPAQHNLF